MSFRIVLIKFPVLTITPQMEKREFYKRCNIVSALCLISMITFALLSTYAFGNYKPLLGALFISITLLSFLIGIGVTIASMGEYKPKKWPPEMPFPIIYDPNKYALVYLEENYWIIEYFETKAEAVCVFYDLKKKNKLHITPFTKVYSPEKGYHNKQLDWK